MRFARVMSVVVVACALVVPATGLALADVVVFGDSLSDTGNTHDMLGFYPPSSYWGGRFSNGPVWVEHLAVDLALPAPTFSRDGGTDYAYGGAETGSGTTTYYGFVHIPNLGTQIDTYLDDVAGQAAADDLFVVWGGGNDLLNDEQIDVSVPVANLVIHVTTLATAGAEEFLVPNLPPLGQTPLYHGTGSETAMDNLSIAFNDELAAELDSLETTLAVTIHRLDVFAMFQRVLADPAAFGFTNVTGQAYNGGSPVANPDEYLFWDEKHPTAAGHTWLGQLATLAVLEPTPGDANLDGAVNDEDASRLGAHWLQQAMATWSDGDFNLDGKVTDADAAILASHWDQTAEPLRVTVPEPPVIVLLLAAAVLSVRLARHKASPTPDRPR